MGDRFLVSVIDPITPNKTLLDRGIQGTSIFTTTEKTSERTTGRVRYDGNLLTIDATGIDLSNGATILFQLVGADSDTGSEVLIGKPRIASNQSSASALFKADPAPQPSGSALDTDELLTSELGVSATSARLNEATGILDAELRLSNPGNTIYRNAVVLFPGLPPGVQILNASGVNSAGIPYINMSSVLADHGIGSGETSSAIGLSLGNPNFQRLDLRVEVLAGNENRAPVISDVLPLVVLPGSTVSMKVSALDPDGDRVTLRIASNSGLPTGGLSADGKLSFTPSPFQVGQYSFDIVASDGASESTRTVQLNVIADPVLSTRISGVIQDTLLTPLANLPVEIGTHKAQTDSLGRFSFDFGNNPVDGTTLRVLGRSIPGNYPFVAEPLPLLLNHEVFASVNNVVERTIYLPRLNEGVTVTPAADMTVSKDLSSNNEIGSLFIGAGTLKDRNGNLFDGKISITEVPVNRTPAALPSNLCADLVVTIQPGEMVFTTPAPLTLPNRGKLAPGTTTDLWSINPATGYFDDVGDGVVSADGQFIQTVSGGIRNSSWHFFSGSAPAPGGGGDRNQGTGTGTSGTGGTGGGEGGPGGSGGCNGTAEDCECEVTSSVETHSGALRETHEVASYQSLGETRGVTLHYDSQRADARQILYFGFNNTASNFPDLRMIAKLQYGKDGFRTQVPGYEGTTPNLTSGDHIWAIPMGAENALGSLQIDSQNDPSGIYQYELGVKLTRVANNLCGSYSLLSGTYIQVNTRNSAFGAGWGIGGLQEIVVNSDGMILLIDGNGSRETFSRNSADTNLFDAAPGDFSYFRRDPTNGSYSRKFTDGSTTVFSSEGLIQSHTDKNGNTTAYAYESGRISSITDPVGLVTKFISNDTKITSIIDPDGRETKLGYDFVGNLTTVTDPDAAKRTWKYDRSHHMVSEVDAQGNSETAIYNFSGRVTGAIRKDGSIIEIRPTQTEGLLRPNQTIDPDSPPNTFNLGPATAVFVDGNGNVKQTVLDQDGQAVSRTDFVGSQGSIARDSTNRIAYQIDARGNLTSFDYDQRGNLVRTTDLYDFIFDGPTSFWISDKSGRWDDPNNWSSKRVPTASDIVFIDRASSDVVVTADKQTINYKRLISSETMHFANAIVSSLGKSSFFGNVIADSDTTFTFTGAGAQVEFKRDFFASNAKIDANDGATISFSGLNQLEAQSLSFKATGEGSHISFGALTSLKSTGFANVASPNSPVSFMARAGGRISFPSLTTLKGAGVNFSIAAEDSDLPASNGKPTSEAVPTVLSTIDLPLLVAGVSDTMSIIEIGRGGQFAAAKLESLQGIGLRVRDSGSLATPNLARINGAELKIEYAVPNVSKFADLSGTAISIITDSPALGVQYEFTNVTKADGLGIVFRDMGPSIGTHVSFPSLTAYQQNVTPNVMRRTFSPNTTIRSERGSKITFDKLASITSTANHVLEISTSFGSGELFFPLLNNVAGGTVSITANQANILLPSLVTFAPEYDTDASGGISPSGLIADGGKVIVPLLRTIANSRVELRSALGGVPNIDMPSLTTITNGVIGLENAGLQTPNLENLSNVGVYIQNFNSNLPWVVSGSTAFDSKSSLQNAFGSINGNLNFGGTLKLGGSGSSGAPGTINGNLTLLPTAAVSGRYSKTSPSNVPATGTITVNGNFTKNGTISFDSYGPNFVFTNGMAITENERPSIGTMLPLFKFTTSSGAFAKSEIVDQTADPIIFEYAETATQLNVTAVARPVSPTPPGSITLGNLVWDDQNNDGIRQSIEVGLDGVFIQVYDNAFNKLSSTVTAEDGTYSVTVPNQGTYFIEAKTRAGYISSTGTGTKSNFSFVGPYEPGIIGVGDNQDHGSGNSGSVIAQVNVGPSGGPINPDNGGTANLRIDFGMYFIGFENKLSIGDYVWNDLNNNGVFDKATTGVPVESGIGNLLVELLDASGTVVVIQRTRFDGRYQFFNVAPGTFTVRVNPPPGYTSSTGGAPSAFEPGVSGTQDNQDHGTLQPDGTITSKVTIGDVYTPGNPDSAGTQNFRQDFGLYLPDRPGAYEIVSKVAPTVFPNGTGLGVSRFFEYDAKFSQLTKMTDELGHSTIYLVDSANGDRLSMRRVIGQLDSAANGETDDLVTRYTYTTRGQLDLMTDPRGIVTDYDYDSMGRVITVTTAKGTVDEAVMRYEYRNANGSENMTENPSAMIDGNGNRTEYTYDSLNRLIHLTEADPDGVGPQTSPVTQYAYDKNANMMAMTDALGHTTNYEYDAKDRMVRVIAPDPDGAGPTPRSVTRYEYDENGNRVAVVDPNLNVTHYEYDSRQRQTAMVDPDGGVVRYGYDADNNVTSIIDPMGNFTQFAYDSRNRQVSETDPLSETIRYEYDGANNLVSKTDRMLRVTEYQYDDVNRVKSEIWVGGGNVVEYAYDPNGNLVSGKDQFSSLAYTYDFQNRMKTADNKDTPGAPNVVLTYAYDDNGNVLSVSDAIDGQAGAVTGYDYDGLDRLDKLSQSGVNTSEKRVDFTYNPLGQYTGMSRFSDLAGSKQVVATAYTYDGMKRLGNITHGQNSNPVQIFNYAYDTGSRITQIESKTDTVNYLYDKRDELTKADYQENNQTDESYRYNANGNRVESHLHGTGYQTNPITANRLKSDGTYNYEYDDNGNLTKRTTIAGGTIRVLTWDYRNRLTEVKDISTGGIVLQEVSFMYDIFNKRIASTNTGISTNYIYDREDVLLEFRGKTLETRYLHGIGIDQVLAQEKSSSSQWLLSDHLGSIRAVVDESNTQLVEYDAYGNPTSLLHSTYGFTGREYSSDLQLYYLRARFYDPSIGLFISEDPLSRIGGNNFTFTYCSNNPVSFMDSYGLFPGLPPELKCAKSLFSCATNKKFGLCVSGAWNCYNDLFPDREPTPTPTPSPTCTPKRENKYKRVCYPFFNYCYDVTPSPVTKEDYTPYTYNPSSPSPLLTPAIAPMPLPTNTPGPSQILLERIRNGEL